MSPAIYAAYAQLLSLGFVFIGFHCVGMCGPILCGLQIGNQRFGLLFYQLGRVSIYMTLGALAGLLGATFENIFSQTGAVISIAFGLLLLAHAFLKNPLKQEAPLPKLKILQPQEFGLIRPLFFGVCLAFMPCMITVWALGIAATTVSPLHGSLVMALLVVLTTPALWIATRIPKAIGRIPKFQVLKIAPAFIAVSGGWMILVGFAGLGWIEHFHLHFQIFNRTYMVMFY